jgi:2,3-bisphosphoglycerate-independent phosphoglycerate mutase
VLAIVVVLLDGLGDRAHDVLDGRTGNEAARTPNLDALCSRGSCGVLYAVGPGRAPSSEVAHWSMLGYRPDEFPGRAVFEAVGRGQDVSPEHVFAYAALRPAERRDDGWWLTGRPDPERDAEEAEALVERCAEIEIDGLTFSLTHVWRGEAVLRISGGADPRVTDSDAFFRDRHPVLRPQAVVAEAERTARAAEEWTRETMRRLEGERFNVITLKWWGRPTQVPSFLERHGVGGTFVGESAFLRGLGAYVGLEPVAEPETDDPSTTCVADSRTCASGSTPVRRSCSCTRRRPTRRDTRRIHASSSGRSRRSTRRSASRRSTAPSSASPATTPRRLPPTSSTPAIRCRSSSRGPAFAATT